MIASDLLLMSPFSGVGPAVSPAPSYSWASAWGNFVKFPTHRKLPTSVGLRGTHDLHTEPFSFLWTSVERGIGGGEWESCSE